MWNDWNRSRTVDPSFTALPHIAHCVGDLFKMPYEIADRHPFDYALYAVSSASGLQLECHSRCVESASPTRHAMPVCEHFMISFADLDRTREVILYSTPASTLTKQTIPHLRALVCSILPRDLSRSLNLFKYTHMKCRLVDVRLIDCTR